MTPQPNTLRGMPVRRRRLSAIPDLFRAMTRDPAEATPAQRVLVLVALVGLFVMAGVDLR